MFFAILEWLTLTFLIEFSLIKPFLLKEKVLVPVFLANLLTNPLVVYLYNLSAILLYDKKDIILFILEAIVVFVEARAYKKMLKLSRKKAFSISFLANVVAYLTGLLIFH